MNFLTSEQNNIILIVILILIVVILIGIFVFFGSSVIVKKNYVTVFKKNDGTYHPYFEGFHLFNPFKMKKVKEIYILPSKVQGKIYKYEFEIEFKVTDYIKNSKYETTFTQELTQRSSNLVLTIEGCADLAYEVANDFGVEILELNYIEKLN